MMVLFGGIGVLGLILWIVALVDCVQREFRSPNDKVIWVLVIVLVHTIGAIIYLVVGKPAGWRPGEGPPPDWRNDGGAPVR
jgi:hypothetical protein